jgi:Dicarboxylate carrier protein MatC N-terminus
VRSSRRSDALLEVPAAAAQFVEVLGRIRGRGGGYAAVVDPENSRMPVPTVHTGALAIVAAFVVGAFVAGESADDIFAGLPGDLFVVLVGVTFPFTIADNNGTVDLLVRCATAAVGGGIALTP